MEPERWQKILDLFNAALELDSEDRERFINNACNGDTPLHAELESLLAAYSADPDYLEQPAASIGGIPDDVLDDAMEGEVVGVYRIVSRIGAGGMGAVYIAERNDGEFRRRVALKLVKRGMDSEEIIRRFRSERQISAALNHPNIARLFDGGIAIDGRPYFVMEYVAGGMPIDRYCDNHRLDITERLHMFRTVASAVQYAHQNLVVHCDLKPGNILVSDNGTVKLLDFGIARPLKPELIGMSVALTRTQFRLLTPQYASPEQIRAEPVTTASDVYALGILLYELLTGHVPYRLKSQTAWEMERAIREEEPELPSTSVRYPVERIDSNGTTYTLTPSEIAAARNTHTENLRRDLQGDLDTIIMKAMHKDTSRRYPSVETLAEDVRRYLEGEPVMARKDSLGYRAGKFIGRHKIGVAAASALFTSISSFGIVMAVQSARIARQARQISNERDKAHQIIEFMKGIFKVSNPSVSRGETVTARELLDIGAERIITDLAGNPEVQSELLFVMGDVYEYLGLDAGAERAYQACLDLAIQNGREDSLETANALLGLAGIQRLRDEHEGALSLLYRVLDIQHRLTGEESQEVALTLNDIGLMLLRQGDVAEAERLIRESLRIRRQHLGDMHRDVARSLNNLAAIMRTNDRFAEAEELQREANRILQGLFGDLHPDVAKGLNNLARLLSYQGKMDEAEQLDNQAYELRRKLLGEHPSTADSLTFVGMHHYRHEDYETAERIYREAQEMRVRLLPPGHPDLAEGLLHLGRVRAARGAFEEAETHLREAIAIKREKFGDNHPYAVRMLISLGDCYTRKEDMEQAEATYREAIALFRETLDDNNFYVINATLQLAQLLITIGNTSEAERLLVEAAANAENKHLHLAAEATKLLTQLHERNQQEDQSGQ